jgi:prepilin-type N-terminal cleavage/methylation domain-containing protein
MNCFFPKNYPANPRQGFTMIELLAMVAIIAVIVALVVPWVGNYTNWAQTTATQHTVAVLNEALNEYRSLGGINKSHSLEGAAGTTLNEQTLTNSVISALATGFTCGNERKTFLNQRSDLDTTSIGTPARIRFRFVANLTQLAQTRRGTSGPPTITVQHQYHSHKRTRLYDERDGH